MDLEPNRGRKMINNGQPNELDEGSDKMSQYERATTPEEVESRIEEWHDKADIKVELHVYLGWTQEEYNRYLETQQLPDDSLRQLND